MTFITIVRLGQINNKNRPRNELTSALKGRIAYLPVDVSATARFLPENLLNIDSLILLVGGQPTQKKNNMDFSCGHAKSTQCSGLVTSE